MDAIDRVPQETRIDFPNTFSVTNSENKISELTDTVWEHIHPDRIAPAAPAQWTNLTRRGSRNLMNHSKRHALEVLGPPTWVMFPSDDSHDWPFMTGNAYERYWQNGECQPMIRDVVSSGIGDCC